MAFVPGGCPLSQIWIVSVVPCVFIGCYCGLFGVHRFEMVLVFNCSDPCLMATYHLEDDLQKIK